MGHLTVPAAERLLDKEIRVLDHGFVRLVDYMGGDARIVQTARVSYGAVRTVREDAALINYLMCHQHTSPFEHVVLEFHCKMPIFVARQWVRHRAARLNEVSGRYSVLRDEFYLPPPAMVRAQSRDNKQGRSDEEVPPALRQKVLDLLARDQQQLYASYQELLSDDIARELARINLPLSLYTEWYWQMDLHNLLHFLALRMDAHAQWEIRQYAEALAGIAKAVAPMAYKAFERHVLNGCRLSEDERKAVRERMAGRPSGLTGRALQEFEEKLFDTSAPAPEAAEPPSAAAAAGLRTSITRDEINRLGLRHYAGPIEVVRDDQALGKAMRRLQQETLLGFDTESRPTFQRGDSHPVAVVQLAAQDAVYIIQLLYIERPKRLFDLLADAKILKVGVALDQDIRKLRALRPFEPAGFVDLAELTTRLGIENNSLRALTAILLDFRISKGAQQSNWARQELSGRQLTYAATDAWVGREMHRMLEERGLLAAAMKAHPPRSTAFSHGRRSVRPRRNREVPTPPSDAGKSS